MRAHRHAARRHQRIGLLQCVDHEAAQRLCLVGRDAEHVHIRARLAKGGEERPAIRVGDLASPRSPPHLDQLIPRRHEGDSRAAAHGQLGAPRRRGDPQLGSPQLRAGREDPVTFAEVVPDPMEVAAGAQRRRHRDGVA